MFVNDNQGSDFSGIPSLGDVQGLETYINNENLKSQGLSPVEEHTEPTPAGQAPAAAAEQSATSATPVQGLDTSNLSQQQVADIMQRLDAINARLGTDQATQSQPATASQSQTAYSQAEQQFIIAAIQRGYSMDQINRVIMERRGGVQNTSRLEQRMASLENYLRSQEYKQAETVFIDKLSAFGDKWGLSEQDLVTFGNVALQKGINIAVPGIDLETVFRAVYPQQYAIRSQRMTPTATSQIYGGTSIPEGNRTQASRAEDAYVEAFLKGTMPSRYENKN